MVALKGLSISGLAFLDWKPVEFAVGPGDVAGVTGGSGSGKTLLLRAIADLDPHEGNVALEGEICSEMPATEWRRRVGMLPAESRWWFDTVGPHFGNCGNGDLIALLEKLGLSREVLDWEVARLSAGERQRLGLARLLARQPNALLLDEPTANLDEASTEFAEAVITEFLRERNAPVVWISHSSAQLDRVATRRYEMRNKRLVEREVAQ